MSPFLGEVLGTAVLILFGGGVVAGASLDKTKSNGAGWVVISLAWGLAVTMGVYASGQFSGAHLNPAVTIGLALAGEFAWADVPSYILAQMIGAFIGAALVFFHYYKHFQATSDQATKLGVFSTGPAIRHTFSNLTSEIIGTFILVLGILFIGANNFTEGLNPLAVGSLIVVIGMALGGTTGYAINPARDLGPRLAHALLPIPNKGSSDWSYSWIPVVGPIIGGGLGALTYNALFKGEFSVLFWVFLLVTIVIIVLSITTKSEEANVKNNLSH
ncbi:aquaporin family protein [Caldibacillus lycopersici]|uniref:Aquaporin family protein n=1 Tax=Perspicuibacillus lycopersici TaxID=1325689 RepID=A0AAE3LPU9_9BACI|nr:MIP/aquaporin family protein [Perspicuibacillus lycopersici]MCU9612699.1 aquaporin family protein [Perspicuibacillus lycopersici]